MKKAKEYKKFIIKNRYNILILILYVLIFIELKNIHVFDDDFVIKFPIYMNHTFSNIIAWIFNRMHYFYYEWSGRLVTHFITTAGLSIFGVSFFYFLHPIILFLMSFLISKILNLFGNKSSISKNIFLISLLSISSTITIVRENHFWITGSVPYVWGFTLTLYIFYILLKYDKRNSTLNSKEIIGLSLLITIQSFILEQYATITMGILFIFFIKSIIRKDREKTNAYLFFGVLATLTLILSCLIPGNFVKPNSYNEEIIEAKQAFIEETKSIDLYENDFSINILSKTISIIGLFLDKDILLIYTSFISFVLYFNWYHSKIKKTKFNKIKYNYMLVVTILFLLNEVYQIIPFFNTSELFNTYLYAIKYINYPLILTLIYIVVFLLYLVILAEALYKYIKQYNIMLWWLWLISIVSIIIPISIIPYHGTRFTWPIFIINVMLIVNMLGENNKKSIISSLMILLIFANALIFENNKNVMLPLIIILLVEKNISEEKIFNILYTSLITMLFANQIYAMCMFYYNKIIIDYNENVLINAPKEGDIYLREIPYKTEKYCWHTFFSDTDGYHYHYVYLHKWLKQYYGIEPDRIKIIESYIPTGKEK